MIIDSEDVEEAMRALAGDARLCSSNEVTRRLSSLLVGYSQADVCLGGPPGMGGVVATLFRGRTDKPSTSHSRDVGADVVCTSNASTRLWRTRAGYSRGGTVLMQKASHLSLRCAP